MIPIIICCADPSKFTRDFTPPASFWLLIWPIIFLRLSIDFSVLPESYLDWSVPATGIVFPLSTIIAGNVDHIYRCIISPVRSVIRYRWIYMLHKHDLHISLWLGLIHASGLEIIQEDLYPEYGLWLLIFHEKIVILYCLLHLGIPCIIVVLKIKTCIQYLLPCLSIHNFISLGQAVVYVIRIRE